MKIILIVFVSFSAFACSEELENKQPPNSKSIPTENLPSNPLLSHSQPNQSEEHISGGGESDISGAPSAFHISGQ
jgi:hypothetical protein